jgi:hypothetical protein
VNAGARKVLNAYVIPLTVLFVAGLVLQSVPYWGWHLLHGFHIETNGVRIWVPYRYRPVEGGRQLTLLPYRGMLFAAGATGPGTIRMDFVNSDQDKEPSALTTGSWEITVVSAGKFSRKSSRALAMAGRNGQCVEYEPDAVSGRETGEKNKVKIECLFGDDLRASFLGSSSSSGTFYEVVASARAIEGKR